VYVFVNHVQMPLSLPWNFLEEYIYAQTEAADIHVQTKQKFHLSPAYEGIPVWRLDSNTTTFVSMTEVQ